MKVFVVTRYEFLERGCEVRAVRLERSEAQEFVAEDEREALENGMTAATWDIEEHDMPLTPTRTLGCDSANPPDPQWLREFANG